MTATLTAIASMAPRRVLADLADLWRVRGGTPVVLETAGGVDAARRVEREGASFDVVFLASDAIDRLLAAGCVIAGSRVDLMRSATAVAVRAGSARPDIGSEASLRASVLAAPTVGCSTGPSGVALRALFARWGIEAQLASRLVQAPPGVPVASLVADGAVALGFQQLSELVGVPGIDILGPLPPAVAIDTTFSAGVVAGSAQAEDARRLLAFMASPEGDDAKRRHGMRPVEDVSTPQPSREPA